MGNRWRHCLTTKSPLIRFLLPDKQPLSPIPLPHPNITQLFKLFGPFFVGQFVGIDMQVVFEHSIYISDPIHLHITTTVLYNFFNSASFTWISSPSLPEAARKSSSSVQISSSPPNQHPFSNTSLNFSGSVCPAVEA